MRIDQWTLAKSSTKGKSVTQRTLVKCCRKMMPMIGQRMKLSRSRKWPNVAKKQWCPSLEDFVSLRTLTKCGPKCAPHWRTLSRSGLWPNVAQNVPLVGGLCHASDFDRMWPKMCPSLEDFVTQQTLTKCGLKCAPCWRTLSCSRLQPNVAENVPLVGGLCHAADFDQMWPKMCLLLEDFVSQRTSTKCGPNICLSTGDIILLRGSTTYGSTRYSSSKKAST